MKLKKALVNHKTLVDRKLLTIFDQKIAEFMNVDPALAELAEAVKDQTLRGGKRLRPFLAAQAYKLAGGKEVDLVVTLGAGLELLHQFLLVHDDIVDRDERRYGRPSLHERYKQVFSDKYQAHDPHLGLSLGMMGGDLLYNLAIATVNNLAVSPELTRRLISLFTHTIFQTLAGWEIHFFQNQQSIETVTQEAYLAGMKLVSCKYTFETPLLAGLILADNEQDAQVFRAYADHAGTAFQIQDDILGMFGETQATGKPVGNDFREGKKTLLVLWSYQMATNEQKLYLKKYLGTNIDQKQLATVQQIMTKSGALAKCNALARREVNLAKKSLGKLGRHKPKDLAIFADLADFVADRIR